MSDPYGQPGRSPDDAPRAETPATAPNHPAPVATGQTDWLGPSIDNVKVVYGLYILSFVTGITAIVGVVFALAPLLA